MVQRVAPSTYASPWRLAQKYDRQLFRKATGLEAGCKPRCIIKDQSNSQRGHGSLNMLLPSLRCQAPSKGDKIIDHDVAVGMRCWIGRA